MKILAILDKILPNGLKLVASSKALSPNIVGSKVLGVRASTYEVGGRVTMKLVSGEAKASCVFLPMALQCPSHSSRHCTWRQRLQGPELQGGEGPYQTEHLSKVRAPCETS